MQLSKELEFAWSYLIAGRRECEIELHDVAQAAKGALIPQLVIVGLRLETVLEGHCARVTILELLVDAQPTDRKWYELIFKVSGYKQGGLVPIKEDWKR